MAGEPAHCDRCGYRVRWNPKTREGPAIFREEGRCPSCEQSFGDRAPVSARRGDERP